MKRFSHWWICCRLSLFFSLNILLFCNCSYAGELVYSTYLGGSGNDYGLSGAVDSAGNIYVTGYTASNNFPIDINAYDITYAAGNDIFISKLDATGTTLLYSTYLGGASAEYAYNIAVDSAGNVYLAGYTASADFPTKPGNYDRTYNTNGDGFVAKLNSTGSDLLCSTYLGGSSIDYIMSLAMNSAGEIYLTGYTNSADFPTTATAYDTSQNGNYDIFVSKLNSGLTGLVYSTFIGGSGDDRGYALALDSSGNAYLTGYTVSADFPTTEFAYDSTANGNNDVFVSKLTADGTGLVYSTYLGGSNVDYSYGIGVDTANNAIVTGYTSSNPFPRTWGAYDTTANGNNDIFITKLNSAGSGLMFSTYLGGSAADRGLAMNLDTFGNIYVTGYTASNNFPYTSYTYDSTANGNNDVFISKLHSSGSTLRYSTYLGGSAADYGYNINVNQFGDVYLVGYTGSNTNFPVTDSAYDTTHNGATYDVFISKLKLNRPPDPVTLIAPPNSSSTFNHKPTFIWSKGIDPDADEVVYLLQVDIDSTFSAPIYQPAFSPATASTPGTRLSSGVYYWRVIDQDQYYVQNTSAVWMVTIENQPPNAVNLIAPPDLTNTVNRTPTFSWETATDPDGDTVSYQLQIDNNNDFLSPEYISLFSSGTETIPSTALTPNTYFWRVISQDEVSAQNTSAVWTITIENQPPAAVSLLIPLNGSSNINHTPTFIWNIATDPDGDAVEYQLQIDNNSGFTSPEFESSFTSSTEASPTPELATGTFFWRVITRDLFFARNTSVAWTITLLNRPPAVVNLLSPLDCCTTTNRLVPFIWAITPDPDGNAVEYIIQVDNNLGFASPEYQSGFNSDTQAIPSSPLLPDRYYWRVIAQDEFFARNSSATCLVTVENQPPAAVNLIRPLDGSSITNKRPSFSWALATDPDGDPVEYQLQVDNTSDFSSPELIVGFDSITCATSSVWLVPDQYYWRVITQDSFSGQNSSETRTLDILPTATSAPIFVPNSSEYSSSTKAKLEFELELIQ